MVLDRTGASAGYATELSGRYSRCEWIAQKRGVGFGRAKKMNDDQQTLAQRMLKEGKSVREVSWTFSVHPATLYRIAKPAI